MKDIDADQDDQLYTAMCIVDMIDEHESIRTDEQIQWHINNLTLPPPSYRYSQRQRDEQYLFFKYKRDLLPISNQFHLYQSKILFVCPFVHPSINDTHFTLISTSIF